MQRATRSLIPDLKMAPAADTVWELDLSVITGRKCITMEPPTTVLPDLSFTPECSVRSGLADELPLLPDGQKDRGGLSRRCEADAGAGDVDGVSLECGVEAAPRQAKDTEGKEDDCKKANLLST